VDNPDLLFIPVRYRKVGIMSFTWNSLYILKRTLSKETDL